VTDLLAHPPDLALAALVDRQLERVRGQAPDPGGRGRTVVELDAVPERAHRPLSHRWPRHDRAVGLVDLEARVRQPIGELAVVGQQDQAGRVGIQPADRVQAHRSTDHVDDRRAPLWVARGRDDPRGLVDRVDDALHRTFADPVPVHRDLVNGFYVARRIEHQLPAHPHPPGADDLLRSAARGDPCAGEELGESHRPATINRSWTSIC